MKLFLDTSVLLAACGSSKGASRFVLDVAPTQGWMLVSTPYCIAEVLRNLSKLGVHAVKAWETHIQSRFALIADTWTLDVPVKIPQKDRPVLMSALSHQCDFLLTLDRADFGAFFEQGVCGMGVLTPGAFVSAHRERNPGP